jgi:hypothetical protein
MRALNDFGVAAGSAPPTPRALEVRIEGLANMPIGDLKLAWREAWGVSPPSGARRRLLMLGIAWKWQAEVHGGHTKVVERRLAKLEATVRQGGATSAEGATIGAPRRLMPSARILRVWKNERHEVHVSETGYLWRGRTYRSLSVIAREITGSRRNGPAFFGLGDGGAS